MKIPDLLDHGLSRAPQRACVEQDGRTLSFADVHRRAGQAATAMRAAGLQAGDRVLLLAANEPEFLELQVACQRIGAAFVPLNFRLAMPELQAIVAACAPQLLVHGEEFAETAAALGVARTWGLGASGATRYDEALRDVPVSQAVPAQPLDGAAIAQILFTSGTTGLAKGAVVTNAALFGRIASLSAGLRIDEQSVFLQTLPLFHLASLVSFAYTAMAATCVNLKAFEPGATLDLIERRRITHTLMVPTIVQALVATQAQRQADLGSLRTVMYGASPFNPTHLARAVEVFGCGFAQLYGMTEAGIAVCLEPADHTRAQRPELLSAAGRDLPFYRTAIVRPDGKACEVGEVGEIIIEGPALLEGYLDNPEATRDAIRGGRMHTGDAGYRDAEGYLFLTDRIKDMIITGGENVYCREVEAVLLDHPAVADAAVIGLPDEHWGQRVHALVVAKPGVAPEPALLDDWCKERLAGYKRPRSYERIDLLPRNAVGKVLKHVLRSDRVAGKVPG